MVGLDEISVLGGKRPIFRGELLVAGKVFLLPVIFTNHVEVSR